MIRRISFIAAFVLLSTPAIFSQSEQPAETKPAEPKVELTTEQTEGVRIAESSIIVYSGLTGRVGLGQVRKTTVEIGKITYIQSDGSRLNADYTRRVLRGDSFGEEKIRFDQKFPNAEYAMIFDGGSIFGVTSGNFRFDPREDAQRSFRNRIVHGVEALLRYRENGSTVELRESEKIMGVEYNVIEMKDKEDRKTRYYVSKKTFRVLMLEYEDGGISYRRKFYDHNYAQGTLVPYRTVLWANDKMVEEVDISTITFGQVVEESLFDYGVA